MPTTWETTAAAWARRPMTMPRWTYRLRHPRRGLAFPFTMNRRGRATCLLEDVWAAARAWAVANGKEVVSTYGVVGVAPI